MNEGFRKFEELLKNDTAFQEKLKSAVESYKGEQTEEAVFEGVLVPVAKEYGIAASFEEFKEYTDHLTNADRELSEDEVNQVAGGGKGGGFGLTACAVIGIGAGAGAGSESGGACAVIGAGYGKTECTLVGDSNEDY